VCECFFNVLLFLILTPLTILRGSSEDIVSHPQVIFIQAIIFRVFEHFLHLEGFFSNIVWFSGIGKIESVHRYFRNSGGKSTVSHLLQHEYREHASRDEKSVGLLSKKPLRLAGGFFLLAFFFRIVDIFILEMNATDFGILPSKIIPIILILVYLRQTGKKRSDIGIHSKNWDRNVILAILTILVFDGVQIGGSFLSLLIINVQPQLSFYKLDYIVFDLVYQTANAFMEEMLFRGLMLICFMTIMRPFRANLFQALLFGLWHVVWPINSYLGGLITAGAAIGWALEYVFSSLIIGLLWGYMFQRTGSLISPILLHFSINFIGAYVFVEPSIGAISLGIGMLAFLLTFAIVLFFTKRKPTSEGRVQTSTIHS
jgi:membrane protease YdiL (CAAX protease family)